MAVTTVSITGNVLGPDGAAPTSGTLTVKLSQAGSALDGATAQQVLGSKVVTLGTGGSVSLALVPNDAITPTGTAYKVEYSITMPSGAVEHWSEYWSLASSPASIAIGAITRVAPSTAAVVFIAGTPGADGAAVDTYDIGDRPTADVDAPALAIITESGEPTKLQACLPDGLGGYAWYTVAQST